MMGQFLHFLDDRADVRAFNINNNKVMVFSGSMHDSMMALPFFLTGSMMRCW